ncbi:unnamed protein product [Blepharisma stoltei]|uniref:Cilia- and flagella-associated protein 300 n=1 Tax=Blepharisma stoltei TaxID=1481888 RepID=A0AAU9IXD4_9CILI|nr:unnamed protein product [Blepharisma stoltei]
MEENFTFTYLPGAVFKTTQTREIQDLLTKWGLAQSMNLWKFRFDHAFNDLMSASFLSDLVNSPDVANVVAPIRTAKTRDSISQLNYTELRTTQTSMDFFNFLEANRFADPSGYISKIIPDYFEEIEICDKIRQAILIEESENYELLTENIRNEFLFRIFQHITIGGGICQYEDYTTPYMDVVKSLYKDLISVGKDESGQLRISSKAYQLKNSQEFRLFTAEHPQDFLYVIVDQQNRHVNLWYHKWHGIW